MMGTETIRIKEIVTMVASRETGGSKRALDKYQAEHDASPYKGMTLLQRGSRV